MARRTRLSPPPTRDPWLSRLWRSVVELQDNVSSLQRNGITATAKTATTNTTDATAKRWAYYYLAADQTGVSDGDLVKVTTAHAKRGEISVDAAGVYALPEGYWRITAGLVCTGSGSTTTRWQWYKWPATSNWTLDMPGASIPTSNTGNSCTGGLGGDAVAHVIASETPTYVGLRLQLSSGTTTIESGWSKVYIQEVDPWDE